ncbi:MAG: hypothetical protein V2A56_08800 [bacterium]
MESVSLTGELCEWLLNPRDPALRAKVLVELLDRDENDSEVVQARERISQQPWVKSTLKAFEREAVWAKDFYQKYRGPSWSLAHLVAVGLPGNHPVMQRGAEFLIERARPLSGLKGREAERYSGSEGFYWMHPIACLTSRMSTILTHAGYALHPVAKGARATCIHAFDPENGFSCMAIELSLIPGCVMAVPEVMKAMLVVAEKDRTPQEKKFLRDAAALLKKFGLYKYVPVESKRWFDHTWKKPSNWVRGEKQRWLQKGLAEQRKEKPGWLKYSFPHGYNPDLIEVLLVLGEAGVKRDSVIDEGIEQVLSSRGADGKWKLTGGLNGKMWADLDVKGKPSPWVTFHALKVLKLFGEVGGVE